MEELYREWARNIERARVALKLTQAELATRCKVSQSAVARWESGENRPKDSMKVRIAEVLHQDVRQLFPLTRAVA